MYYQQQQSKNGDSTLKKMRTRTGTLAKIDDRFYANSGKDKDDGDDDYAPWNDRPDKNAEPAPSRTHRVVQQRMAPPEAGEKLRV